MSRQPSIPAGPEAPDAALSTIWADLVRATVDRRAAERTPTLATISKGGRPEARLVVLRGIDPPTGRLEIHTDRRSSKAVGLSAQPRAALVFWNPAKRRQLRVTGAARLGDAAETASAWKRLSPAARAAYGAELPPGAPLAHWSELRQTPEGLPDAFALLFIEVAEIDRLELLPEGHRRLRLTLEVGRLIEAGWVAP